MERKFDVGVLYITQGVANLIEEKNLGEEVSKCLIRHHQADWGDMCEEDKQMNDWSLANEGRLLSSYEVGKDKTKIWIITEWDRSCTTILLPEEY